MPVRGQRGEVGDQESKGHNEVRQTQENGLKHGVNGTNASRAKI